MNTTNETNTTQDVKTQDGLWVPIDQIVVPEDARPHSEEDIDSRAVSMDREGQAQNVLLSKEGDKLVLVYGHGRYLSAKKLGWEKLRCDIKEGLSETQKLMLTLAENEEREDASPFFIAELFKKLKESNNWTDEQLSSEVHKEVKTVRRYLSLANVNAELKKSGQRCPLGLCHWLEIIKLQKPEDQIQLAQECAEKGYSVRELQARVKQLLGSAETKAKAPKPAGPAFQFHWKNGKLVIKVRPFDPAQEGWAEYSMALDDASNKYRAAFPKPEDVPTQEVTRKAA